ncbi:MAG: S-layer homology domain-containing protein [Cyanobacteriota bacterium]|nr:S-layer homology domain-containing protein [Cyanobacteriota bacterium]
MVEQRQVPEGYYAAKEVYGLLDWRMGGGILETVPPAPLTFWDAQIQYNQLEVHKMSCTIFAAAGAISDLTGYRFNNNQFRALVEEAKKDDFSDSDGWYIYKAVDLVRHWWKRNEGDITSYRLNLAGADFVEALKKGYSIVTGYRGNSQYDRDVAADGVLDKITIGNTTYGHAIRISRDRESPDYARLVIDNYLDAQPFNTYRIKIDDLPKMVNNGVFYYSGYIFVSNVERMFKDVVRNSQTEWYYSQLEWAVKEGMVNGYEDETFRPDRPVTRAEMVILLKRLHDKLNKD